MSGFKYVRVLNNTAMQYARALNFQGYTEFTYFREYDSVLNMHWNVIMEGLWIFQDSEYDKILHMQALQKVLNMSEYRWIMPEQTVLIMVGLWICLVKVPQDFEHASSSIECGNVVNLAGFLKVVDISE